MNFQRQSARALLLALLPLAAQQAIAKVEQAQVDRIDDRTVTLSWSGATAVDVYVSENPRATPKQAILLQRGSRAGQAQATAPNDRPRYFLLVDKADGQVTRVAERALPLEKGSNFRDLGGYAGAGGKTVRWGKVFRTGAMSMLNEHDYDYLGHVHVSAIVDFRSLEEREIAPTGLDDRSGALFISNDYSIRPMFEAAAKGGVPNGADMYRAFPRSFVPQYRALFRSLLADDGAVVFNCSAGQDRTGTAAALVLTALGVSRDVILRDYHLSTQLRRPENEIPPVDPADHPKNPILQYYAAALKKPGGIKAEPLAGPDGKAYLDGFFAEIESRWGSVDAYLSKELGIGPAQLQRLRTAYLE